MASAEQILGALERVAPDVALVLAADMALGVYEDAYREAVAKSAPAAHARCSREVVDMRRAAGRVYVDTVAKTASTAAARFEVARIMPVLEEAVRVRDGIADLWVWASGDEAVSKEEIIQRDGWTQRVKRDERGRFSRTVSTKGTMSAGAFASRRKRADVRSQPAPGQPPEAGFLPSAAMDAASDAADEEAREAGERRLYAINEVAELQQELKRAFGGKAPKIDVSMRYLDSEGNVGQVQAGVPGEDPYADMAWAEQLPGDFTPLDIQYGPGGDLSPDERQTMAGQMALGELPGLNMQTADPALISELGRGVLAGAGGPALSQQEWDEQRNRGPLSRLAGAVGAVEDVADMVPGFGGVADLAGGIKRGLEGAQSLNEPMQQSMWRMRGTSKKPGGGLREAVEGRGAPKAVDAVVNGFLAGDLPASEVESLADRMENARAVEQMPRFFRSLAAMVRSGEHQGRSPEQLVRMAQREAAASVFVDQMKERMAASVGIDADELESRGGMANLQMYGLQSKLAGEVGRGFPSEGVVLDAQGRVVQQSVGLGEDHYLPFNLEGMAKLRDGSYVRTREYGGLTGEDLRTLLASGARSATVVSRSGMFDLELEPDMVGARRYNDKTAQMASMYERILDAVSESGLYVNDIPKEQRDQWEVEAARLRPGDIKGYVDQKRQEYLQRQSVFTSEDVAEAEKKALARWRTQHNLTDEATDEKLRSDPEVLDFLKKEVRMAKKNRVRQLTVNAEGYEVALKTLQRYFPYYIRDARRRSLTDVDADIHPEKAKTTAQFLQQEGTSDPWYVQPGDLTARGVDGGADMALQSQRRSAGGRVEEAAANPPPPSGGGGGESVPGGGPGGSAVPGGAGVQQSPAETGGGVLAGVQGDPFGDMDVDELKARASSKADNAKMVLTTRLGAVLADVASFLDVVAESASEGGADGRRFYLLSNPADTEQVAHKVIGVIAGGDKDDKVKALKILGRQPRMVAAMLSDEQVDQAAEVVLGGEPGATAQHRQDIRDAVRGVLTDVAETALTLYADWQKPPEGSLADAWRAGAAGPFALEVMRGVTDVDDIDALMDADIDDVTGSDRRTVLNAVAGGVDSPLALATGASRLLDERSAFLRAVDALGEGRTPEKVAELFSRKVGAQSRNAIRQTIGTQDGSDPNELVATMPEDATRPAAEAAAQLYSLGVRRSVLETVRGGGGRPKAVPPRWGDPQQALTMMAGLDVDELERKKARREGFAKRGPRSVVGEVLRELGPRSRRRTRGRRR